MKAIVDVSVKTYMLPSQRVSYVAVPNKQWNLWLIEYLDFFPTYNQTQTGFVDLGCVYTLIVWLRQKCRHFSTAWYRSVRLRLGAFALDSVFSIGYFIYYHLGWGSKQAVSLPKHDVYTLLITNWSEWIVTNSITGFAIWHQICCLNSQQHLYCWFAQPNSF